MESTEWLFSPLFPGRIGIWNLEVLVLTVMIFYPFDSVLNALSTLSTNLNNPLFTLSTTGAWRQSHSEVTSYAAVNFHRF